MGFEADYVFTGHRHELFSRNTNLTVQPGHRRQLPEHGYSNQVRSQLGECLAVFFGRPAGLPLAADGLHEALRRQVARFGDVPAFSDVGRNPTPRRRLHARAGYGRRTCACRRRAAPPPRHERDFRSGLRLPVQRDLFLRIRSAVFHSLRRRSATAGVEPDQSAAPQRLDRAAQRLRRRSRFTGSIFVFSGGFRSVGAEASMALLRCSTCSTVTIMEAGSPTKRTRITGGRIRIPLSPTSRGWRSLVSAWRSDLFR